MTEPRRFLPPWSAEETEACFIVRAAIRFSARGNTPPMRLYMPPLTRTFAATLFATILGNLATICLACAVFRILLARHGSEAFYGDVATRVVRLSVAVDDDHVAATNERF